MNSSKLGMKVLAQGIDDGRKRMVEQFIEIICPTTMVIVNNWEYTVNLAKRFPNTVFIARLTLEDGQTDDNLHRKVNYPYEWVNWLFPRMKTAPKNIWLYYNNEPQMSDVVMWQHTLEICRAAIDHKVPVVIMNSSMTKPTSQDLIEAGSIVIDVLRLAGDNPKYIKIGIHLYQSGDMSKDFPHDLHHHRIYYEWAERYGLRRPQIVVTEGGWDSFWGTQSWRGVHNAAQHTPRGRYPAEWLADQIINRIASYRWDRELLGYNLFCFVGNNTTDWAAFDLCTAPEVFDALYVRQTALQTPELPPVGIIPYIKYYLRKAFTRG